MVDSAQIGPNGRAVKCAKCGHAWAEPAPPPNATPQKPRTTAEEMGPDLREKSDELSNCSEPAVESFGVSGDKDILGERTDPDNPVSRANFENPSGSGVSGGPRELRTGDRAGVRNLPAVVNNPRRWPTKLAWLLLIIVVGGTLGGGVMFRDSITSNWPVTKKFFEPIGLTSAPEKKHLSLRSVEYSYPSPGVLKVTGELVNLTKASQDVPNLRVMVINDSGETVKVWKFPPHVRRILPNEVVKFSNLFRSYPADSKRLEVGLAPE